MDFVLLTIGMSRNGSGKQGNRLERSPSFTRPFIHHNAFASTKGLSNSHNTALVSVCKQFPLRGIINVLKGGKQEIQLANKVKSSMHGIMLSVESTAHEQN